MLDAMSIQSDPTFDQSSGSFIGGNNINKALVSLARGISTKWKYITSYDLIQCKGAMGETLKRKIFSIIQNSEQVNIKVRFVVTDIGIENQQMWRELEISEDRIYFKNPFDENRKVYICADVQHVLKNIT